MLDWIATRSSPAEVSSNSYTHQRHAAQPRHVVKKCVGRFGLDEGENRQVRQFRSSGPIRSPVILVSRRVSFLSSLNAVKTARSASVTFVPVSVT